MTVISAPADWVESVSQLRFPEKFDRRLQELMDRNNEGQLSPSERDELESLVEYSEGLSLVRAESASAIASPSAMTTRVEIERQIRERAGDRCEYCRMHQSLQGATFHVEHIVPQSKGGTSDFDNLAWACPSCNLHKADRIEAIDRESGRAVAIFHPRRDAWLDHFQWDDLQVDAFTDVGRATIAALNLNSARRLRIRHAERMFDLFPPD